MIKMQIYWHKSVLNKGKLFQLFKSSPSDMNRLEQRCVRVKLN